MADSSVAKLRSAPDGPGSASGAQESQADVIQITQVRSVIGAQQAQRRTLRALGLRRIHQTVSQPDRPEIRGMVAKVSHLVEVRGLGRSRKSNEETQT